MKKNALKSFYLLMVLISIAWISYTINQYLFEQFTYQLKPQSTCLIMGDSHPKCALNPALIPNRTNISQSAEPYFISQFKLPYLHQNNPHINTVILGLSPHNISGFNDFKLSDPLWCTRLFSRNYLFLTAKKIASSNTNWYHYYIAQLQYCLNLNALYRDNWFKKTFKQGQTWYPHIGSYRSASGSKLTELDVCTTINKHYTYKGKAVNISKTAINALSNLINYCATNNLKLIIVLPPLHPSYTQKIPTNISHKFEQLKNQLNNDPRLELIDLSTLPLPNNHFADYDHLNNKGAAIIAKKIAHIIENTY
jgi:hypothetical protein